MVDPRSDSSSDDSSDSVSGHDSGSHSDTASTTSSIAGGWTAIGGFTYSIGLGDSIRFTVERSTVDPATHQVSCDEGKGLGRRETCGFTEPSRGPVTWRIAWQGDRMSRSIERDARAVAVAARGSAPGTGTGTEDS